MEYQYVTNKNGKTIAVVVPLQEWEALQSKLEEECLTDAEIKEAEQSWRDYLAGKGEPVDQVMKELLEDRND
jgi:PHD/YefM family antitoxin component YafN of YafNO toxin-antitoxin module